MIAEVRQAPISNPFQFAAARDLYASKQHPRLFVDDALIAELRERRDEAPRAEIMAVMRKRVRGLADMVLASDDLPAMLTAFHGNWHNLSVQVVFSIHDMAMVALLDNDADVTDAVIRLLEAASEIEDGRTRSFGQFAGGHLAMAYDLMAPQLSDEQRKRFASWCKQHCVDAMLAEFSNYFRCAAGNVPLGRMVGALLATLVIDGEPSVTDLSATRNQLVRYLEATLHSAIGPDGYPEEDMGYGTSVAGQLCHVSEALHRAGFFNAYEACPHFVNCGRALLHFVQPWGKHLSNTGDHGDDFGLRELLLARQAAVTDNPSLLWLLGTLSYQMGNIHPHDRNDDYYAEATYAPGLSVPATVFSLLIADQLEDGERPSSSCPTAFQDRARGIVSFRSGWQDDDTLLIVDGSQRSPIGQGHAHASCGHFMLSAVGEYFAVGCGRYNMEQDCHNVVLVGGTSGRSSNRQWRATPYPGRLTDHTPNRLIDHAAVDSSHQHNCYWAWRHVMLVKGGLLPAYAWVVENINQNSDWGEYWWQLHTSPENTIDIVDNKATITGWRHGNCLDVHFRIPPADRYPRPHQLTLGQDVALPSSLDYFKAEPAELAARFERPSDMVHGPIYERPRLLAKMTGYNGNMMSLMLPRLRDTSAPKVESVDCLDGSLAMVVERGGVRDTLIFAYHHQLLEADGVVARGLACVVRRRSDSGEFVDAQLVHGNALMVDGKRIDI